jgi:hypothetical protein
MPDYTQLKGVGDITDQLLAESLQENLLEFFDWACLEAGGFVNVSVPTPGVPDAYGDDNLVPVQEQGVPDGTIWQTPRSQWVYATGLPTDTPPTIASGVYVGGAFYPSSGTDGTYQHYLDYPNGRVVFSSPIPTTSVVQAEYSYRWVNWYEQDTTWFRDVVFDAFAINDQPQVYESGITTLLNNNRVQLPAVIIETVMNRRQRPLMLGNSSQWVEQDFLFHILSERSDQRNNLMDVVSLQKDKPLFLYDVNARRRAGDFATDWRGSPVPGAKMYPDLVSLPPSGYRWKVAWFSRMTGQDTSLRLPLYRGIVRATLETDFGAM